MTVNSYITAEQIKAALPDESFDTSYDAEFARLAIEASREIDRITNRQPGAYAVSDDETRYYEGEHSGQFVPNYGLFRGTGRQHELTIDELADVPTSVSMTITTPRGAYTALTTTDYFVWPYNYQGLGVPINKLMLDIYNGSQFIWYSWPQAVKVIGKFGYSTTAPSDIQQAALILAVRHFKRGQQAFAEASANATLGQMMYVKGLDPSVDQILSRLTRVVI